MMVLRFFLLFLFFTSSFITSCSQASKVDASVTAVQTKPRTGKGRLIVIDPGHGGFDIGANTQLLEEKALALRTAILAKKYLNDIGYRVILTRSRDVFVPLKERTAIANDTKSKLFVSVHYNAHRNPQAKGIEVYFYQKSSKCRTGSSKKLAEKVLSCLLDRTGAVSRGVKHGNFHVIRETNMPAILVEGGFITNSKEQDRLKEKKYINQIAHAIAEGIDKYFNP